MKPINKLTVDLLTEKYVNNGTLESKFKELFDRIAVVHGDMKVIKLLWLNTYQCQFILHWISVMILIKNSG